MKELQKYLNELLETIKAFQNSTDDETRATLHTEVEKKVEVIENIYRKGEIELENRVNRKKFEKFDFLLSLAPTIVAVLLTVFVSIFISIFKQNSASAVEEVKLKEDMARYYELSARTLINSQKLNADSDYFKKANEFLNIGDSLKQNLYHNQSPAALPQ